MTIPAAPSGWPAQLAVVLGALAAGTIVAQVAGAVNLGVALGVGQLTFTLALVWVLLRG